METRYTLEVEDIKLQQISVLEAIYNEGQDHLKWYHNTMKNFKFPEKRIKAYDTNYYEKVLPVIIPILRSNNLLKTLIKENE